MNEHRKALMRKHCFVVFTSAFIWAAGAAYLSLHGEYSKAGDAAFVALMQYILASVFLPEKEV